MIFFLFINDFSQSPTHDTMPPCNVGVAHMFINPFALNVFIDCDHFLIALTNHKVLIYDEIKKEKNIK